MTFRLPYRALFRSRYFSICLLFLLSPVFFFAQTLTGLWTGALSNDSTTVRKDQSFEIALTEYRGKVYGYSRSEFIVDDTLYYMVKRVKGTIEGDVCEVTDDEIVAYNFKGKLDKGIKVTSTFRRNQQDSSWYLAGTWKTNATKKYYSVTGKVDLAEEKDLTASKIFPHLEELNLANDVAFYKERTNTKAVARIIKPEKIKTEYSTKTIDQPDNNSIAIAKPSMQPVNTVAVEDYGAVTKDNVATIEVSRTQTKSISSSKVSVTPGNPIGSVEEYGIVGKDNVSKIDASKTTTKSITTGPVTITPSNPTGTIESFGVIGKDNLATIEASKTQPKTIATGSVNITPSNPNGTIESLGVIGRDNVATIDASKTEAKSIQSETVKLSPSKPLAIPEREMATLNPTETNPVTTTADAVDENGDLIVKRTNTKPATSTSASQPATVTPNETVKTNKVSAPAVQDIKNATSLLVPSLTIGGRKTEFTQIVSFKADSIELALYDNGEIDGDTVSIYLNGEPILSRQGLKASAIKKTIHIPPGQQDFTLVLFAENLGKYPPNTGLLVVHDGNDTYNLRFSSDFQKNAGIVFRRQR